MIATGTATAAAEALINVASEPPGCTHPRPQQRTTVARMMTPHSHYCIVLRNKDLLFKTISKPSKCIITDVIIGALNRSILLSISYTVSFDNTYKYFAKQSNGCR